VTAPKKSRRNHIVIALFLVSAAGLIYEITLTRLFSLYFQYHYVFLAISIAVLGLSLGAATGRFITTSRTQKHAHTIRLSNGGLDRLPQNVLIVLSLSFSLVVLVIAWLPSAESVLPRALVSLIPFILIGLFSALAFSRFGQYGGLLYGADLGGAAVGVVTVLGLLKIFNPFNVVLLLGMGLGLAAVLLTRSSPDLISDRRNSMAALLVLVITGGLLGFNLVAMKIDYAPTQLVSFPRDKTMVQILKDRNQSAKIVHTEFGPFARVDVIETSNPEEKFIFTDAGAGSYMYHFDGRLQEWAHLKDTIEFLPFSVGSAGRTLVIGAGGGKDVLLALLAGSSEITAVEVNPAVVEATRAFTQYNGGILDLPEVQLVEGEARTFVERADDHYDMIYLNLVYTQAAEPGSKALVENYIFTQEAFQTYLEHLTPNGHLGLVSHNALEGSRAAVTALFALEKTGVPPNEALDRMALLMYPSDDPTQRMSVLLVGGEPLTQETLQVLTLGASRQGMTPLFVPGSYEFLFERLRQGMTLDQFVVEGAEYDLGPTYDDRPFFFDLDPGLPPAVKTALIIGGSVAVLLFLSSASLWGPGGLREIRKLWIVMLLYAVLIGAGFLLVEIPLIHRFQLLLGHPVLSFVTVLGSLLLFGGLGSLYSQRWEAQHLLRRVVVMALWVGVVGIIYWLYLPSIVRGLLPKSFPVRLISIIVLTALIGFPMGVPFPSLLRLSKKHSQHIALLLAVNGVFSVLGSIMAVVIAMGYGFRWSMATGAGLYLILTVFVLALDRMDLGSNSTRMDTI
jgi:predicted membrane-bound spermidine synthase